MPRINPKDYEFKPGQGEQKPANVPQGVFEHAHINHTKWNRWNMPQKFGPGGHAGGKVLPDEAKESQAKMLEFLDDSVDMIPGPTRIVAKQLVGNIYWMVIEENPGQINAFKYLAMAKIWEENGEWNYTSGCEAMGGFGETNVDTIDEETLNPPDEFLAMCPEINPVWRDAVDDYKASL